MPQRLPAAAIVSGGIALATSFSQSASAASLPYESIDTPSLAVFNGQLFMAYSGTDSNHRLPPHPRAGLMEAPEWRRRLSAGTATRTSPGLELTTRSTSTSCKYSELRT